MAAAYRSDLVPARRSVLGVAAASVTGPVRSSLRVVSVSAVVESL